MSQKKRSRAPQTYEQLMLRARRHNRELDSVDGGLLAHPPDLQIATAMSAVEAGVRTRDWDCVCQGLAILEDLLGVLRRRS